MVQQNIEGAKVTIIGANGTYEGVTNSAGIVEFTGINEDNYTLTVSCDGYEDYESVDPIEWTGDSQEVNVSLSKADESEDESTEESTEQTSETEQTSDVINIEVTIDPVIIGAKATLSNESESYVEVYEFNDTGLVTFPDVPYDTYTLLVTADGYNDNSQTITVNSTNNNPRSIKVTMEQTTSQETTQ